MLIEQADFNGSDVLLGSAFASEWHDLAAVLRKMPLHLKASDQAGLTGKPIFDPVGTNAYLKEQLTAKGWQAGVAIPETLSFLGTNVDFVLGGLLGEVQFSNYPFLLNNVVRSELFYKAKMKLAGMPTEVVIIITKGKMFPASNSTLYYEQARNQLNELSRHRVFDAPIRLVGLQEVTEKQLVARWTAYDAARYSRTIKKSSDLKVCLSRPRTDRGRSEIQIIRP